MQILIGLIWLLVWGAFSSAGPLGISEVVNAEGAYNIFNSIRSYVPFFAVFLSFLFLTSKRPKETFKIRTHIAFLTLYGIIGLTGSLLSPFEAISVYWALVFLCVPLTGWLITGYGNSLEKTEILLQTNWIIAFLFVIYLSLGPLRPYIMGKPLPDFYIFPGGIARITQNGVGRYAGVAAIIAFSRIRQRCSFRKRIGWILLLALSLNLLSVSQSRTALFGFAGGVVIILISFRLQWIAFFAPVFAFIIYLSGFLWAMHGTWEALFFLSGRGVTWSRGLEVFSRSPFVGFGFHADRYLMQMHHMHNAFLHSLVQSGIFGTIFFIGAFYGIWFVVVKNNLIKKSMDISNVRNIYLSESLAVLAFLTLRSFFESTAAFYGADLFFIVPVLIYIHIMGEMEVKKRIEKNSSFFRNNL